MGVMAQAILGAVLVASRRPPSPVSRTTTPHPDRAKRSKASAVTSSKKVGISPSLQPEVALRSRVIPSSSSLAEALRPPIRMRSENSTRWGEV